MKNYARESRPWLIWLTVAAVILIGVGIFFYYNLFRQEKSELIEAIPTDAAFILALNDNDGFVSGSTMLAPYLDELLVLDAMPAFQTMRGKLPTGEYDLSVSGHADDDGVSVLFNMHADKAAFKRLLHALSIDPNNYTAFEGNRIYTYGTNFKSMKFTYVNHIISLSTDIELLKRAVVQHTHPKNLLSDKQFKKIYELTEKNRKQNWLMVNPERYTSYFSSFLNEEFSKKLADCLKEAGWTALQLRFSGNEMFLSGFASAKNPEESYFLQVANYPNSDISGITESIPSEADWYILSRPSHNPRMTCVLPGPNQPRIFAIGNSGIGHFSIHTDSVDRCFTIILPAGETNCLETLYDREGREDSIRAAHPDGLFPIPGPTAHSMGTFAPDSLLWFVENGNTLVCAESPEDLKLYQKYMKTKSPITQNRLYPFVNEAVASSSLFNFVLLNDESATYLSSKLSEKGQASQTGKNLRIFSISSESSENDELLLPVNLYLLF